MNRILHVVPGLGEKWNGISVAARLFAKEQGSRLIEAKEVTRAEITASDEIWVHSTWSWRVWRACILAVAEGKRLVRMTHGNLDPVRRRYHAWKKLLAGPVERFLLRRASCIVVACEAEKEWIKEYLGKRCPQIEVTNMKRFFKLSCEMQVPSNNGEPIHLLYLGRSHPLKGLEYLEKAVKELSSDPKPELRIVSNAFGEEKEKVWEWCDVFILPTLSDNFGLVIAEALEHGKRVITTDGAPAWDDGKDYAGRLIYIRGYRDGSSEDRVRLLKEALARVVNLGK